MPQQFKTFCILFITLATLAACATRAPLPPTEWQAHQDAISNITHFTAKGKVALITPNERLSAQFFWEQKEDVSTLRLTHFLGQTLFKLEINPNMAVLTDNNGQRHYAKDPKNLLFRITGFSLPVNEMSLWIKGLPASNNAYNLGEDNRLASLSQYEKNPLLGWQIQYNAYDENTNNLLPSKIQMHLDTQKVNLLISEWTYTP